MHRLIFIRIIAVAFLLTAGSTGLYGQNIKGKEIVGVRLGGIHTTGSLRDSFGKGSEIELHFIEGIGTWFGIGFALSSHNLGESKNQEKDFECMPEGRQPDLQIYSMTASFVSLKNLSQRFSAMGEAGVGLYSINAIVTSGVYEGYITNNRFGFFGGIGTLIGLTRKLSFDVYFKLHFIVSGNESKLHCYTGSEIVPLYQITLGISYKS